MLANLKVVWRNCFAAGSKNLVLARVIETEAEKESIVACVPDALPVVCQLRANQDTLVARISKREIGTGAAWHEQRSLELAASLQGAPVDFEVDTECRSIIAIAEEIVGQISWQR